MKICYDFEDRKKYNFRTNTVQGIIKLSGYKLTIYSVNGVNNLEEDIVFYIDRRNDLWVSTEEKTGLRFLTGATRKKLVDNILEYLNENFIVVKAIRESQDKYSLNDLLLKESLTRESI